ncbi:hypothetical protein MTO96_003501 [Rhipicephalus appendiculatus]
MRHVGVGWIPLVFGVVLAGGALLTFVWAVARGDVTPYMPFVSEAGADPPQSGFFSLCLFVAATFGLKCVLVRYQTVRSFNASCSKKMDAMNGAAAILAVVSFFGMAMVASFPMSDVPTVHSVAANVLFYGLFGYQIMQTIITYWMYPLFNGRTNRHRADINLRFLRALCYPNGRDWLCRQVNLEKQRLRPPASAESSVRRGFRAYRDRGHLRVGRRPVHGSLLLHVRPGVPQGDARDQGRPAGRPPGRRADIFRKSPYMSETTYLRAHET